MPITSQPRLTAAPATSDQLAATSQALAAYSSLHAAHANGLIVHASQWYEVALQLSVCSGYMTGDRVVFVRDRSNDAYAMAQAARYEDARVLDAKTGMVLS